MDRKNVQSDSINSIGYDEKNQILEIEFNKGFVYQYFNVPKEEYKNLMNADSHGKYLNTEVKGKYSYNKI